MHTFQPGLLLTISPFYHYNRANYDGDPNETPISTTQHRASQYAGSQIALSAVAKKHNVSIGLYGFGQHDDEAVALIANDSSGISLTQAGSQPATWRRYFWRISTRSGRG